VLVPTMLVDRVPKPFPRPKVSIFEVVRRVHSDVVSEGHPTDRHVEVVILSSCSLSFHLFIRDGKKVHEGCPTGFEPAQRDSQSPMLPLHHGHHCGSSWGN
jgi:hypothetical protein